MVSKGPQHQNKDGKTHVRADARVVVVIDKIGPRISERQGAARSQLGIAGGEGAHKRAAPWESMTTRPWTKTCQGLNFEILDNFGRPRGCLGGRRPFNVLVLTVGLAGLALGARAAPVSSL